MRAFSEVVYPAVLSAMATVLVAGAVALVAASRGVAKPPGAPQGSPARSAARLARLLNIATRVARSATFGEIVAIGVLLVAGVTHPPIVMLVGYLIAAVAVLALLGISRLAAPPAPGQPRDPDRPVLGPRQAIQVDAVAAILVAVALAVVAWRLHSILLAG